MIKGVFPVDCFKTLDTPFYYYDSRLLHETLDTVRKELAGNPEFVVHYAVKANFNKDILAIIAGYGLGADCVSGGEVSTALNAGFAPEKTVFAGVGKSDKEIALALENKISRFNVESAEEITVINQIASSMGLTAPISVRVNPDIGAHTHSNITTGLAENKFGIYYGKLAETVEHIRHCANVEFLGLHFHIGSQILNMQDFVALCNRINEITDNLRLLGITVKDINVGGGLGINYEHPNHLPVADFHSYFNVFRRHLALKPGQQVHFELGRSIVAPCGSLITRALFVKEGLTRKFVIVDAGMTDLIRPALYHACHRIENLSSDRPEEKYDVVGPVCESSDVFAKSVSLNNTRRGDILAIRSAGAYGESMASGYNCRPLPQSVII